MQVDGIQGKEIDGGPTNGDVLVYSSATGKWEPTPLGASASGSVAIVELALAPGADGNFTVAHGLGVAPSLALIEMDSDAEIWFQSPARYDATNLYLVSSDASAVGRAICFLKSPDLELALVPVAPGNFTVAHGLGQSPALALLQMTSGGRIWFQDPPYDATNLYLVASDAGATGNAPLWKAVPRPVVVEHISIDLTSTDPGPFQVAHTLGSAPTEVLLRMTSAGIIRFQSPTRWDDTYIYLVASDGGLTGKAEAWT
jgi:hypothetical protein